MKNVWIKTIRGMVLGTSTAVVLSGCGASGDPATVTPPSQPDPVDIPDGAVGTGIGFDVTSGAVESSLRYVAVATDGQGVNGNTGALDHDTGEITSGSFAGTLNGARTQIALTDGGTATLTALDGGLQDYVRIFSLQGSDLDRFGFGVIGIHTDPSAVVTGNSVVTGVFNYIGNARLSATNASDTYAITGDADVGVNFRDGLVAVTFNNLTATGNADPTAINPGTLTISDANVSGAAYIGGQASGSGTLFDGINGAADTDGTRGEFFGPDSEQVGGTVSFDNGTVEVLGVYIAEES